MAYTITLTNGNTFATVADGTTNTQAGFGLNAPMTLIGKNYAGYGQMIDDNFIRLLESGANSIAPSTPLTGQIWWDTANAQMKVYSGTGWKAVGGATSSAAQPTTANSGDLWFDSTNQQLKVYNGTNWLVVGPPYSSGQGITGAVPLTINDSNSQSHTVLQEFVGGTIVGIISQDPLFVPQIPITGFTNVRPGYNLASTVGNTYGNSVPYYWGTASNSLLLDGHPASDFVLSSGNATINGNVTFGANVNITTSLGVGLPGAPFSGVNGEIRAANNVTAFYTSDSRFKENIQDIPGALSKVECIGGKTFDWKDDYIAEHGGADGYFVQKSDFGVIAQDVQEVFPLAVRVKPNGTLAVDYEKLAALSFAAVKELNAKVDALIVKLGFKE